jgi:hypothetical protein
MGDFGDILRRGKLRQILKSSKGIWEKCEYCEKRRLLYEYVDNKQEKWMLCAECINDFIKDEEK